MRRTTPMRALAAGAGAAAVLLAASPALATPDAPFDRDWAADLEAEGYTGVSCVVSQIQGNQDAVFFTDDWDTQLDDGNDWVLLVLEIADETDYEMAWEGYAEADEDGAYTTGPVYQAGTEGNITRAMLCQAALDDGSDPADEATDEPAEAPADEPADEAGTEEPTGPPVETDGPSSSSGLNAPLVGGGVLALAGAGVAGLALRRRSAQH